MSETPPPSFFALAGGALGVRRLVDRFYDLMDSLEEARALRALHPASLEHSREKLYEFMSGWLGGPPLYMQKHGHPRLRARHFPFAIDDAGVEAWLLCMDRALDEQIDDVEARDKLKGGLRALAQHMKNRE